MQLVAPKKANLSSLDQIMADVTASNLKRYQIQGDQKISPVLRAPRAPLATDLARSPAIWHIPPCAPVSLRLLPPGFSFPPLRLRGRRRSLRSGKLKPSGSRLREPPHTPDCAKWLEILPNQLRSAAPLAKLERFF